jgi:hypothetical protein
MLVAPWRKHLAFAFDSGFGSGDLHDAAIVASDP